MQVNSKYQNPDKYIEKLKDEIKNLNWRIKEKNRLLGRYLFTYEDGALKGVLLDDPREYPELLPGTRVIFKGKVVGVTRTQEDCDIKFELNDCKIVEEPSQ